MAWVGARRVVEGLAVKLCLETVAIGVDHATLAPERSRHIFVRVVLD